MRQKITKMAASIAVLLEGGDTNLKQLLRGKIIINDHRVNEYIEQHYNSFKNERLKDLKIYFTDEGLRLCALIKLHDMLPEISAEAVLVLESFDFKPGMHIFIFRLKVSRSLVSQSSQIRFMWAFFVTFLRML